MRRSTFPFAFSVGLVDTEWRIREDDVHLALNQAMTLPNFGLLVPTGCEHKESMLTCWFEVTAIARDVVEAVATEALERAFPDAQVNVHVVASPSIRHTASPQCPPIHP